MNFRELTIAIIFTQLIQIDNQDKTENHFFVLFFLLLEGETKYLEQPSIEIFFDGSTFGFKPQEF